MLGATRIGHGYHCVEDPEVVRLIKEKNIHLEVGGGRVMVGGGRVTVGGGRVMVGGGRVVVGCGRTMARVEYVRSGLVDVRR